MGVQLAKKAVRETKNKNQRLTQCPHTPFSPIHAKVVFLWEVLVQKEKL